MNLRSRVAILLVGALCALAILAPRPAFAQSSGSPTAVIADCLAHPGGLTGVYTLPELRLALEVMPTVTKDYTSCPDVVNRALLAAIGAHHKTRAGPASSTGSILPTPVIVVLVLLGLGTITFGAIAIRRR